MMSTLSEIDINPDQEILSFLNSHIIKKKKRSVIPVYGVAAVWVLYCLIFPLYKPLHTILLACSAVLAYVVLSVLFPGKTEYIEIPIEPERSGDELVDALLAEGDKAVAEMNLLRDAIPGEQVRQKLEEIISVIDKIFKKMLSDPGVYSQVKRFSDFYLPTTIKLLHAYDRFGQSGASGENVSGTIERIDTAFDTILESYKKFFDSLFKSQALDIETDIIVLENMLKKEGLIRDFRRE